MFKTVIQYFDDDSEARVCKDISVEACREVKGNFFLIVLGQFFSKLADILVNPKVVLPSILSSTGAPPFLIGLIVPIREAGSLLPQLAFGAMIRSYAVRKWFLLFSAVGQSIAILIMCWGLLSFAPPYATWIILFSLCLMSLMRGLSSIASKDVIGKTIPKQKRGKLTGWSTTLAGALTFLLGLAFVMGMAESAPESWLLLGASLFFFFSSLPYGYIAEYQGATDGGINGLQEAKKALVSLRNDHNFLLFLCVRALMLSSTLLFPFLIVQAQQLSDTSLLAHIGTFILIGGIASLFSGFIWGHLSDKFSVRVIQLTSGMTFFICLMSLTFLVFTDTATWLAMLLFFILSITHDGFRIGRKTYILDITTADTRTHLVALSNTITGLLLLVLGLISALIANISMPLVFILFMGMSLFAFVLSFKLTSITE